MLHPYDSNLEHPQLSFICTLSQFRWLILCYQSAACSSTLSLLPNSAELKDWLDRAFSVVWTVVANLPDMGMGECNFLPEHWLSLCWLSAVAYTPDLEGLELTFGFTEAGIAMSTSLVFSAEWCL